MKNNGFCSDLLVAKKIMVFVGFQSVQIWIFLCSFSPTCLVAKKISIRQFFFFLGHRMGPEVPWSNGARGAREACLGPAKKPARRVWAPQKNPFTNQAEFGSQFQARGSGPI